MTVWICKACQFQFIIQAGKIANVPSVEEYQKGNDPLTLTSSAMAGEPFTITE